VKITVSLDTQAVTTQPSPLRFKGGCFNSVEIAFTSGATSVPLPAGAVIEFSVKSKNQWTGAQLAYLNAFTPSSGNLYSGMLNCATASLLTALGLSDDIPASDVAQVDASAEVTWSFGNEKFRSITFAVTIEAPITDSEAAATPDPVLYPAPSEVARKSDIEALGSAAHLNAGVPNGVATLDEAAKLTGAQLPDVVALKADLKPTGSNRIVIANRYDLGNLPASDANENLITKVNIGDVVHQNGNPGTPRTATVVFSEHTVTDDDVNNWLSVNFYDENGYCAYMYFRNLGDSGTVIAPVDLAFAFANAVNWSGLNVIASIPSDGQVSITSNTPGLLPNGWGFGDDSGEESYSEVEGTPGIPPGDFVVTDLNSLGNANGYQGIGNTVDFLSGYGAPTADIGEEGNGYVDQNNGDFYHRDASGWQFILNIRGPQGPQGDQGVPGPVGKDGANAMRVAIGDSSQIATLLWKCKPVAYAVGSHPQSLCFDGTNIWVTNNGSNNVTKLNATTGTAVGTYSVGTAPVGICYDGTYIWVANSGSNSVTKLIASTGGAVGTYTVGTSPQYLCYDGANIWVTNAGSNNVMRLTANTGVVAGTYATDSNPAGICFDGTNIWVANCNYTTQSLSKFVAATGVLVKTYSYLWNVNSPLGICFDGTNIWTANSGSFGVAKIVANTAAFVWEHFTDTDPPYWICFDGTYIWATYQAGTIRKLSTSDGSVLGRYKAGSGPRGICFDGTYMWVANYYDNTVSRL
jgi:hypothetical protein